MALQLSTNTVYYGVGQVVGPNKVIDMAKAMGMQHMWAPVGGVDKRFDLADHAGKDLFPQFVGGEVAFGQYGITVMDNATGMATLAAGGVHADTHFVDSVYKGSALIYKGRTKQTKLSDTVGLTREEVADETWAMKTVIENGGSPKGKNLLAGGRPAASKTGTWQLCTTCTATDKNRGKNSDAWYAGFTPQLATVVHIGSKDPNDRSIAYYDGNHHEVAMNGVNTPGDIWKKFMDKVLANKPKTGFPNPPHVGDPTKGNAQSPEPSAPPTQDPGNGNGNGGGGGGGGGQPCQLPQLCTTPPLTPTRR
jgi:membrane peptidoglycan carboxypeptidase